MSSQSGRLLIFTVAGERFAIPLQQVAEVLEPVTLSPIPKAPLMLMGIMNFHGSLVPLLDMSAFLHRGSSSQDGKIIVLDRHDAKLGLWVEPVVTVIPGEAVLEEENGEGLIDKVLITEEGALSSLSVEYVLAGIEEAINS